MGVEWELQITIYNKLRNDPGLQALGVTVYDFVSQPADSGGQAQFPYVVIGDATFNEWDTDTELGFDIVQTLHTWSRYQGDKEVKQIQGAIYSALHRATLDVTGHAFVSCDREDSQTFKDSDGRTIHGVCNYRILLDQTL